MSKEIQAAVDAAIEKGTFTLEAVEGIKELRQTVTRLEDEVRSMTGTLSSCRDNVQKLTSERDKLLQDEAKVALREKAVAEAAHAQLENKIRYEYAKSRGDEFKEVLLSLTRNTLYRQQVMKNGMVPDPSPQAYAGSSVNTSETENITSNAE